MPNFSVNASASSADSGAVPEVTARMLARSSRVQVGVQHHPQRGGHQRHRAGSVPAHRVGPLVELEAVQQHERPCLGDALQHPEHAADVHQRGVDDRDAAAEFRRCGDVSRFGADHAARQHVVGEVDPFRRTGGAAGQHPYRDAGAAAARPRPPPAASGSASSVEIDITVVPAAGVTSVARSSAPPMITGSPARRCRRWCVRRRGTG